MLLSSSDRKKTVYLYSLIIMIHSHLNQLIDQLSGLQLLLFWFTLTALMAEFSATAGSEKL